MKGFLFNKAKVQADKYCKRFGPGALCYALGFSENSHVSRTLIMSVPREETIIDPCVK